MSMNPAGEGRTPDASMRAKPPGAGVVTHSSGLILLLEEPRSVTGVRGWLGQ